MRTSLLSSRSCGVHRARAAPEGRGRERGARAGGARSRSSTAISTIAAKALDQAIALNPRRVDAYVLRSAVFAARKQYKEGIALMRRAQAARAHRRGSADALGSQLVLSGDADGRRAAAPAGRREGSRALRRAAAARPSLPRRRGAGPTRSPRSRRTSRIARTRSPARTRATASISPMRICGRASRRRRSRCSRQSSTERKQDLRARIGVAWATAALDCRQARPLLRDLDAVAEQHPEVWLVDGQCALALGDSSAALALGRRYLEKSPEGTRRRPRARRRGAGGARQPRRGASKELETARAARALAPALDGPARVRAPPRRTEHGRAAALDKLGPPAHGRDRSGLVDRARRGAARDRRCVPVRSRGSRRRRRPRATTPELRTVFGAAQLQTGQARAARSRRSMQAEAIAPSPRAKKLLADALTAVGAAKLAANDAPGAEALLARAIELDGNAIVLRDLGIAQLALDKNADRGRARSRGRRSTARRSSLMLAARAHALAATSRVHGRSTSARSPSTRQPARDRARLGGVRARRRRSRDRGGRAREDRPRPRSPGRSRRATRRRSPMRATRPGSRSCAQGNGAQGRRAPARGRRGRQLARHEVRSRARRGRGRRLERGARRRSASSAARAARSRRPRTRRPRRSSSRSPRA